jgi:N-acetylmuramate 1-kinase
MNGLQLQRVTLPSLEATEQFAQMLALWLRPGFAIYLQGDLGAGKSTIARGVIRAIAGEPDLEVPSPTFSLVQSYDTLRVPVLHVDLYRLANVSEVASLGLDDLAHDHALLVEWPERLEGLALSQNVLSLAIAGEGGTRHIAVDSTGNWHCCLARDAVIGTFLAGAGIQGNSRSFLQGDASTRRYETVAWNSGKAVLMDMPARSDPAIIKHGKSYSALVHLADEITPVLAVNQHLAHLGYSAPKVFAGDRDQGLAVIEYLDGEVHGDMMRRGDDMLEPMLSAVDVLADMAGREWPRTVVTGSGFRHNLPDFDTDAQLFEVDLMPSWFWPQLFGKEAPPATRQSFEDVWRNLLPNAKPATPVWMLRDYHSPNLIWLPQREGLQRTGIIDTQDAVMGHPAYDLVSLLQDARVDVDPEFQSMLYQHYVSQRVPFDVAGFDCAYAVLGAQRATRLLGTFTRLSKRDGKHHYLQHRPRVARYLIQNLAHPALAPLATWYQKNLPLVLELAKS